MKTDTDIYILFLICHIRSRRSSEWTRAGERKERPSLCRVAPKAFRALRSAAKGSAFGNRNFWKKN